MIAYSIISINNYRMENKAIARKVFSDWKEEKLPSLNALNDDSLNKFYLDYPNFKLGWSGFKRGEIGNFASHYIRWKFLINSDFTMMLILEDDLKINSVDVPYLIEDKIKELPKEWDIYSVFVDSNQYSRYDNVHGSGGVVLAYQDWSTLAYIVSKGGAEKLCDYIENNAGMDDPTDWFIFRKGHRGIFNVYTNHPGESIPIEIDQSHESLVQNTLGLKND